MSLYLGNTKLDSIYLGSTKIGQIYKGSNLIYQSGPHICDAEIEFTFDSAVTPSLNWLNSNYRSRASWVSTVDPRVWKLEVYYYTGPIGGSYDVGLKFLCVDASGTSYVGLLRHSIVGCYCSITGWTINNTADLDSIDRMFLGCDAINSFATLNSYGIQNVNQAFAGLTYVDDSSAYDQYVEFYTNGSSITSHSSTFADTGSNTQTGLDYLDQIPVGWGGNYVPSSTLMTSNRYAYNGSNYSCWRITGNAPDWTQVTGIMVFTESSVSRFAGVSMNRSRIRSYNSLATASGNALYFYLAFVQMSEGIPGETRYSVTWLAITDSPNGSLASKQGNTDMPGTLDESTYGAIAHTFGTFNSSKNVYFVFFVTNVPISSWTGLTDAYGFLWNAGFNTDAGLRYYF